jgi:hypothetical protein
MSVRDKPVASRHLDLKEKDISYRKHVNAVHKSQSTINTTPPDVPRRLQVAAVCNERHRRGLLKSYADHGHLIFEAVHRAPTARSGLRQKARVPAAAKELDAFTAEPRRLASRPPTAPAKGGRVVAVRIGYGDQPIVEEEEGSGDDLSDE